MKKIALFLIIVLVVSVCYLGFDQPAKAAPTVVINSYSADTNTSFDYCFGWTTEDLGGADEELDVTTDNLVVGFYSDEIDANKRFDLSGLTISDIEADTELYVYFNSNDCGVTQRAGYEARPAESMANGTDTLEDRDYAFIHNGQPGYTTVIIDIDDDATISPGDDISIGFVTKAGNTVLTPIDSGNYKVLTEQYDDVNNDQLEWWDIQLLYIGGANEINISSTVDPTLSLTLSSAACDLGVFDYNSLSVCEYDVIIQTNATNGYAAYIREDGVLTNAAGDTIDATSGSVTPDGIDATEEYGVGVITTDTVVQSNSDITVPAGKTACDAIPGSGGYQGETSEDMPAFALSTSDTEFVTYTEPVNGTVAGVTTMCHAAKVATDTEAGVYTQVVTITAVGNF